MENRINVSAPGKLMLFGEHAVVYKYPCIVMAVNQRMKVEIEKIREKEIIISAPQLGLVEYRKKVRDLGKYKIPKTVRFIEVVTANIFEKYNLDGGLEIETKCDFSASFGFGSSAAVTVSVAYAIFKLYSIKVKKRELFDICYKSVLEVQGVGSGFDIAAAVYGGVLYFVGGGDKIEKLNITELPLVVGYTGIKADTPTIIRQVAEFRRKEPKKIKRIFSQIGEVVNEAKQALVEEDWETVADLMVRNQFLLRKLGVSSIELDRLITHSREAGATAAKLSGAGGGDCMIALVDTGFRLNVEKAIKKAGGKVINVELSEEGVKLD